jgi:hypothetical protein
MAHASAHLVTTVMHVNAAVLVKMNAHEMVSVTTESVPVILPGMEMTALFLLNARAKLLTPLIIVLFHVQAMVVAYVAGATVDRGGWVKIVPSPCRALKGAAKMENVKAVSAYVSLGGLVETALSKFGVHLPIAMAMGTVCWVNANVGKDGQAQVVTVLFHARTIVVTMGIASMENVYATLITLV